MPKVKSDLHKKTRVLIVSSVIPVEHSGAGCLTMYRHFALAGDFDVAFATERDFKETSLPYFKITYSRISARIRKSRYVRVLTNADYVRNWFSLPDGLEDFARKFKPDVIFSVVDDWHMGLAWCLSRKLNIPLAVDFQDLFALSTFIGEYFRPYPPVREFLLARYRFLNRNAEVVFHVGQGMKEWFKGEERGDLLYPMASIPDDTRPHDIGNRENAGPVKIVYTGNCRGPYGRMVLRFADAVQGDPRIQFQIFSLGTDMPDADLTRLKDAGIYRGYLPFAELEPELSEAEAFLLVMSFEDADKTFVETSFNTKWVDYVSYGKPIFVWGPAYSSAITFAKSEGAAAVIDVDDPKKVVDSLMECFEDPERIEMQSQMARTASKGVLNPHRLQTLLKSRLQEAILSH